MRTTSKALYTPFGTGLYRTQAGMKTKRFRRKPISSLAVASWDAAVYDAASDSLLDLSGGGLNARLGSGVGVDSSDPLRLVFSGVKYFYLPGSGNNVPSTPDSATADVTGDLTLVAGYIPDAFTPASNMMLTAKWTALAGQRSYALQHETAGTLRMYNSPDGTTVVSRASTVTVASVALPGQPIYVAASLDVNNGAGGNTCYFWYSYDGVSWQPLGTSVVLAGTTSIANSTTVVTFGSQGNLTADLFSGRVYLGQVFSGLIGSSPTLVVNLDPKRAVEPYATFVATTGEIWTLNRSATGRKLTVVDRTLLLFGTDDYLNVPNSSLLDAQAASGFTVVAFIRRYGSVSGAAQFLMRKAAGGPRWALSISSSNSADMFVNDGTTSVSIGLAGGPASGVASLFASVRDKVANTLIVQVNSTRSSTASDTAGATTNAAAMQIGRLEGGGNYFDGEAFRFSVFQRALTEKQLNQLLGETLI